MKTLCLAALLFCAGCSTTPKGGVNVLCFDVHIQLGGTATRPDVKVDNDLAPNSTQIHSLPMDGSGTSNPTSLSLPK